MDTSAPRAGAVYVFTRSGASWSQQAYLKASNPRSDATFGNSVALAGDTLVVGSAGESSNGSSQTDQSAPNAGAVYVFTRTGTSWSQQAYLKASNVRAQANFGGAVALSDNTLAVGSVTETSGASGVNANQLDTSAPGAGAVYAFARTGTAWTQQAYLKASNTRAYANFGQSVAVSGDTVAVGAQAETSKSRGINSNQLDASARTAGAAYVFARVGTSWSQEAYIKPSNTLSGSFFGVSIALAGETLVVGAYGEASKAKNVNGDETDASAGFAGAAYVFARAGTTWSQEAYVKASNTRAGAQFGEAVAIAGDTLAVGATLDSSGAVGVDGDQADTTAFAAGAVYLYTRVGQTWSPHAYVKASNTHEGAQFGRFVSLSGDTLAVGSHNEASNALGVNGSQTDTSLTGAGAAYVYR